MSIITDALNAFLREFGASGLTQQASFRGVPFITETESDEEFGRRLAIHDYPNSSNRYAEDTGGFADHISVSGCVIGQDAVAQYQRLKAACNQQGHGELVLSVLGSFKIKCGKCSATCNTAESTEKITFNLEFYGSEDIPKADIDVCTGLGCFGLADNCFDAMHDYLNQHFGFLKTDAIASLMRGDLFGMCHSLLGLSGLIDSQDLKTFKKVINTIQKNANRFLFQAKYLGDMLFGDYGGAWRLMASSAHYQGGKNALNDIARIANYYGDTLSTDSVKLTDSPENITQDNKGGKNKWDEITANRRYRNRQRELLISIHKLSALVIGYLILANIRFDTSEEATEARNTLEYAYCKLVHGQAELKPTDRTFSGVENNGYVLHQDSAILQSFEQLRVYALKTLDNAENIAYRVQKINVNEAISVLNLAYLTQAENIHSENDLLGLVEKLAEENDRIFKCSGQVHILT